MGAGESDDGASAHFAARSGRGGNGDATWQAVPIIVEVEILQLQVGLLHQQAQGFADVQRTAAAKGDDRVTFRFTKCFGCRHDIFLERVGVNVIKQFPCLAEVGAAQMIGEQLKGGGLREGFIRHDERAPTAHLSQPGRQLSASANTIEDCGWKRERSQMSGHGREVTRIELACTEKMI